MLFQVQKSKVLDSHPRPHECISELLLGLGDSIGTRDVMSVRCLCTVRDFSSRVGLSLPRTTISRHFETADVKVIFHDSYTLCLCRLGL